MKGFALYRLPHQQECHYVVGDTEELGSLAELNGRQGFVVAPFRISNGQPLVLIHADHSGAGVPGDDALDHLVGKIATEASSHVPLSHPADERLYYAIDFASFLSQLRAGSFRKLVLSRCAEEAMPEGATAISLFRKACESYPRMMISLVGTPQSGLWLTATPEILLESDGSGWRTIALAGTMKLRDDQLAFDNPSKDISILWTTKNIQEQRYVVTYITECLEQFTKDFHEEGPYTVRAANLVHLRSDFTFTLPDSHRLGDLLQALHPTPAVCGLPKREAYHFITHNEHTPRSYYSGFMGPLSLPGGTHLFVSLRCMQISRGHCRLYAGGGLLRDSQEEQEWQETEAKLETMRNILT